MRTIVVTDKVDNIIFITAKLRLALKCKKGSCFATALVCPKQISIVKERFSAFMKIVEKICKQYVKDCSFNPIYIK